MSQDSTPLRILFVTPVTPFSHASGSEQRSALMLAALQELAVVDVLLLCHGKVTAINAHHSESQRFVESTLAGNNFSFSRFKPKPEHTKDIEDAMGCNLGNYQAIVGRYVWPICQLAAPAHVPLIVDLDDFKFRYSVLNPSSWHKYSESIIKSMSHLSMRRQLGRFDLAFVVTDQDRQLVPSLTQTLLPNVPLKINDQPNDYPLNRKVLFVGSLWYEPNHTGVNWFLKNVWPEVKVANPDAELTLVGAAPRWRLDKWAELPGVRVTGYTNNIDIFYDEANVVVVPILSGGGSSIKVLEALAQARPCVVTDFVAKGYANQISPGRDYLVAITAAEFIEKIQFCFAKNEAVESIASQGRETVINRFSPNVFKDTVINAVNGAIESKLINDNTKAFVASPKKTLIRGAAWSVGTRWAVKGVGFINTVVMARLILPEDYGIVAMAFLIVALIQAMVDFGASTALMRKNEVTRDEIDSAWTLRLMQNLGVAILLIIISPLASMYFEEPRVLYVLLIFSVCVAMSGLTNIGLVLAQKEFDFSLDFRVQVIYKTVSVLVTIVAGYFLRDYRALVVGVVAGYISGCVLSYALHPYRPRWNTSKIGEIWAVTKWLMVAGVGGFILRKGDELIAGRVGTTAEFGQYNVGSDLGQLPTGEVGPAMLKALLPVLVAIRGGHEEVKAAVIKTMSAVNTITLPIGFGFAAVAAPATAVILGPSWAEAAQYVAVFSVAGALQVIQSPLSTLLLMRGHTKTQSQVVWIEFTAFILMALILTPKYHLIGLVWARIVSLTVNLVLTVIASKYYNKISIFSVLNTILRPLIGSVLMFYLVQYSILHLDGDMLKLISGILCGAVFFSIWTVSTWLLFGQRQGLESTVLDYVKQYLNNIRKT